MLYEKAVQYAEDAISGKELATEEVKTQCRWFLRDLGLEGDSSYPYYFDREVAGRFGNLLKLMNFATGIGVVGQSVYEGLAGFQAFFLANVF